MTTSEPMMRLKYVASINRRTLPEDAPENLEFAYVDISAVTTGQMSIPEKQIAFCDAPSRSRRLAAPGDVVISTVRTYLRAVAQVPETESDVVFSTGFAVIHPDPDVVEPAYLAYAMQADPFTEQIEARSVGVSYPAVNATDVGDVEVWAPTLETQRAISKFLDRETAQIDAMVNAQERLVELLEERRTTVVDQAVTRGLQPSAEMVPSGIPWIGDVPKNWSIQRIRNLGKSSIGLTYSPEDVVDGTGDGTLVLRAGNVRGGSLVLEDTVYVQTPVPSALRLRSNDILICTRNGSAKLIGKSVVVPERLAGHTWGAFMTVLRSPLNDYLRWVLASSIFHRQVGLFSTSTINQLTNSTFHSMRIPVPSPAERHNIAQHLDHTTARIDTMITKARESIALMKERRAALISAAVTGKIDVRTGVEQVERELEEARA